ncbi:MAG: nucleoside hydrolase [Anaerolineae bacterium]|nr:nucleoside hydrolase [Anaerolineae bacterium]
MNKIPVILDTDIGSDIDDTWALIMLLNCPELDLRLVTTVGGDTVYRAHLTAKLLQTAGRSDVPIAAGLNDPDGGQKFQQPWLEGFDPGAYPGQILDDGAQAMVDVIMASSEPVTVIAIAVATNIARALEIEPRIASKCRFVGMHGSVYIGYDGQPGAVPETNVRYDVPALRKVFAAPWLEKIITPLDTCGLVVLDGERYQQVYHSESPMLKALIENYKIWAKLVSWMKVDYEDVKTSVLFDTVAVYLAYSANLLEMETIRLRVTDDGLTLLDPAGDEVKTALRWRDLDGFHQHLLERLNP